jgi:hypothetical protein
VLFGGLIPALAMSGVPVEQVIFNPAGSLKILAIVPLFLLYLMMNFTIF